MQIFFLSTLLKRAVVLPAGAAAAAVMSSSKTVLRPATGASASPGQPTVQHIIHQTIQVSSTAQTEKDRNKTVR